MSRRKISRATRLALGPLPGPVHSAEPLPCLKVGFDSEASARDGAGRKMRAYRCPMCAQWHRTSNVTGRGKVLR